MLACGCHLKMDPIITFPSLQQPWLQKTTMGTENVYKSYLAPKLWGYEDKSLGNENEGKKVVMRGTIS